MSNQWKTSQTPTFATNHTQNTHIHLEISQKWRLVFWLGDRGQFSTVAINWPIFSHPRCSVWCHAQDPKQIPHYVIGRQRPFVTTYMIPPMWFVWATAMDPMGRLASPAAQFAAKHRTQHLVTVHCLLPQTEYNNTELSTYPPLHSNSITSKSAVKQVLLPYLTCVYQLAPLGSNIPPTHQSKLVFLFLFLSFVFVFFFRGLGVGGSCPRSIWIGSNPIPEANQNRTKFMLHHVGVGTGNTMGYPLGRPFQQLSNIWTTGNLYLKCAHY